MSVFGTLRKFWHAYLKKTTMKKTNRRLAKHCDGYYLSKEQEAAARAYFAPYGKIDMTSHNFYFQKTQRFCENYLPEDLLYGYVDPYFNDWREAQFADNKSLYRLNYRDIPQPVAVAMRIKGLWYDGNYRLTSKEELVERLAKEPEIVVKIASESGGGSGVSFVPGKDFLSAAAKIRDDIVAELPLRQHEKLAAINPSSVNTLRIVSLLTQEGVKFYSAVLRFGIKGSRVDNSSAGGYSAGVDLETGRLKKDAYLLSGVHITQHPDSGIVFDGYEVPGFHKALEQTRKLHLQTPRFRLVHWDFAIDEQGEPVFIEANMHYGGVDLHQLDNGPIFGDDTKKILDEVFTYVKR